jgi:hypothetical protein
MAYFCGGGMASVSKIALLSITIKNLWKKTMTLNVLNRLNLEPSEPDFKIIPVEDNPTFFTPVIALPCVFYKKKIFSTLVHDNPSVLDPKFAN